MPFLFYQRLIFVLSGLWFGAILAVGYLVAPTIFMSLPDRQLAGEVAGEIFKNTTLLTVSVQVLLMFLVNGLVKRGLSQYRTIRWYLLIILLLAVIGGFVIQPWMNELKLIAQQSGLAVMASPHATTFGRLHGVSSILFLCEALLGLTMLWKISGLMVSGNQVIK